MILDASKDVPAVREFLEKFHEWMKDDTLLPSADRVCQMKKMLHEVEQNYEMYQHLQDPKKDEQLEDSRKDQDLEDTKKDQELEDSRKVQKSDDSEKYKELEDSKKVQKSDDSEKYRKLEDSKKVQKSDDSEKYRKLEASKKDKKQALKKDKKLEDSKEDQELEDSKKDQLGSFMEEPESPLSIHFLMFNPEKISFFKVKRLPKRIESTDSNFLRELQASSDFTENGPQQPPQTTSYTTSYAMENVCSAEMLKLMEEECSLAELVNCSTIPTPWFLYAFEDFAAEMRNASVVDGISKNNQETETGGEDLETVQGEEGNSNQQSLKMEQPYYCITKETLKKPSLEKSEKVEELKASIEESLLDVVSDTNPSEYHSPSDSNSNAAQNVVVNRAESAPVETQRDHLSEDEESQTSDATLDEVDCTMEELTDLSGDSATSAMHEYLEGATVEAVADDESGSVHADHSGCNTEKTAYAPVPAKGVQPMLMHSSVDEGPRKATSASVTEESPDMEDLWDKELSREDAHVSDKKMPQADAQAEEISSTLETVQKRLRQTDQVVSALTQDQATDVTKSQGIVHPQAAQVVEVCQATALPTVHKCPQFTQTLTLPTSQVTVQAVYDPPQSGVMVTAAQMWEAPQARALPVAQVCTFEAAPKSAPAAVQVGCTFETDLVLVPRAPQECALDVDQGTSVQTGQVSAFSSHVAGCKAGDGVAPISKAGNHSQAEASHYTECTALPTSDELSHSTASQFPQSAPPRIVIDDVIVQQKWKVDVQNISHVSDNQSSSEGEHVPQQEEAGNGSVAPNPSTAIPSEMVVISLSSSVSKFARNMVGLPTCTLYTGKTKEEHKNVPAKEDSDESKKKAMDRLRKEREERVKQTDAVKKTSDACSSSSKASGGVGDSDVSTPIHQTSHAVTKGLVLLSNVPHIFPEGAYVPLPSQEAMAKSIGKGGNGVVAYIYHGGREFAVKETGLRQEELETWSSVNHRNVIEICAVVEGDWDLACPGARRCFQMMPRVTGDLKSLLEEKERPTLCHYFFDFKEDSESAGLVLGNAKYILLGVLNGLKHLHSLGIMHRDIKLQNILVNRHCQCRDIFLCPHDGDSGYGVLISDFDSALQVERGREKLERTKLHGRPIKYSVHGTAGYRPPETSFSMTCNEVLPEWVSLKTDIWSFGTMLVKFFVGSRGPHSQREMATLLLADCLQSPTAAQRPEGVKTDSLRQALAVGPDEMKRLQKIALLEKYFPLATDLHRLVQYCLTVNVEERPTVEQVMEKAFFRPLKQDSH